ncbi:LysR family transcriptional regulator [Pseudonocardia sp. RS11V-5]|uniref:LysR family transcriptional regulator n=1 Tax=Pseudonocardia terrae TaxID=2905831 RepID=UPI001E36E67D|nr:LysR family transcriptional regulator [Pseudonocardia terrae]MCE3556483.1 LysR family transcriptional regulator [Pseudonocardia terrae]
MLDPVFLRSFVTVARTLSFTRAADRLGVRQSTVSQHVRKLEAEVGRTLLARDTHTVALTPDGEAMLEFATTILDTGERALAHFRGARVRGRLRFGVSEDLVARLPTILAGFRRRHPEVDLELTVGLSETLETELDRGELDLLFAKRSPGRTGGTPVWHDRFVWVAAPGHRLDDAAIPLVSYPPPSLSRAAAIAALEAAGRPWRMACTSGSLSGLRAAALAGLGVVAHAETLIPAGLVPVAGLPRLGEFDFTLQTGRRALTAPAEALAGAILDSAATLQNRIMEP